MACPGGAGRIAAYWVSRDAGPLRAAGPQTIRIQTREDGLQIDQIVLSPVTFFSTAPGCADKRRHGIPAHGGDADAATDVVLRADDSVVRQRQLVDSNPDSTAADGRRLTLRIRVGPTSPPRTRRPSNKVEIVFTAVAGVTYRTWLRLSATSNSLANDSVWVQYDGSVDSSGNPVNRMARHRACA